MVRAKGDKREIMNSESVRFEHVIQTIVSLVSVGSGTDLETDGCFCTICRQQAVARGTIAFEGVPKRCPLCLTAAHRICMTQSLSSCFEGAQ